MCVCVFQYMYSSICVPLCVCVCVCLPLCVCVLLFCLFKCLCVWLFVSEFACECVWDIIETLLSKPAGSFLHLSLECDDHPDWEQMKVERNLEQDVHDWIQAIHTVASFNQDRFTLKFKDIPSA